MVWQLQTDLRSDFQATVGSASCTNSWFCDICKFKGVPIGRTIPSCGAPPNASKEEISPHIQLLPCPCGYRWNNGYTRFFYVPDRLVGYGYDSLLWNVKVSSTMKGTGVGLAVGAFVFLDVLPRTAAMDAEPYRYYRHHSDRFLCYW